MPDSTSVRRPIARVRVRTRCSICASSATHRSSRSSIRRPATPSATSPPAVCRRRTGRWPPPAPRRRPWARTRPEARGSLLKAGARALREHARELAALQTLEVGMPLRESLGGVEAGIAAFEAYAELGPVDRGRAATGDLVLREPRGVVAILMPWCDPLAASCGALAAALVSGNAVVLKPSEKAPLAAERMVELLDARRHPAAPARRRARRPPAGHAPRGGPRDPPRGGGRGQPPGDRRRGHRPGLGGGRGRGQRVRRCRSVLRVGRARLRAPRARGRLPRRAHAARARAQGRPRAWTRTPSWDP